ncbi:hypothetical protein PMAYCL1PPCAC_20315 [Pristionchus mayeri]|uniref:Uncharacterized protein n=1 Tax=Pristionchus mayeri TaxID=1317129 RepID=A0AAN5CT83_9BILA|nr:hypothetical protein PMAYCL1PPCAC_20315 [Pristionchus mayeri]
MCRHAHSSDLISSLRATLGIDSIIVEACTKLITAFTLINTSFYDQYCCTCLHFEDTLAPTRKHQQQAVE